MGLYVGTSLYSIIVKFDFLNFIIDVNFMNFSIENITFIKSKCKDANSSMHK